MRIFALLVCFAALASGCAGDEDPPTTADTEKAYTLSISGSADAAADEAGVDLEALVQRSVEKVLAELPHRGRVGIEVTIDPTWVIPEIGVGGTTDPRSGTVFVQLDYPLRDGAETWIPATLAHELHHSSRIRTGPGYGETLGEAFVTEGLADHFVGEVFPATPPHPWDSALSKKQESDLWRRAKPLLEAAGGYDHRPWFFGGDGIPRWTGYTLGYRIVDAYLTGKGRAADAVGVEASTIIEPYAATTGR